MTMAERKPRSLLGPEPLSGSELSSAIMALAESRTTAELTSACTSLATTAELTVAKLEAIAAHVREALTRAGITIGPTTTDLLEVLRKTGP